MTKERFAFGRNWQSYLSRTFSEERAVIAGNWLSQFLGPPDLKHLSFLDIGSGSGMHSLAAVRAGAARVVSFDYDPASVAATRSLREYVGNPDHWQVCQGSVLDSDFMAGLGQFDVVYAWGVLHHTGDQWRALEQAARRVGDRGRLYLGLYASEHQLDPEAALVLKRRYNRTGVIGRSVMEADYIWGTICRRNWKNLLCMPALARAYRQSRGMAVLTDARDWLGGWPTEFSSVPEVHRTLAKCGLTMIKVATGQPNTEYLFATPKFIDNTGLKPLLPDQVAVTRLARLQSVTQLSSMGDYFIFGTSKGAEMLAMAARRAGCPPVGFIDITRDGHLAGLPIRPINRFAAPSEALVVLSNSYIQENTEQLWRAGYTNILNAHPLVVAMMLGHVR